jgi:hypothetical protein
LNRRFEEACTRWPRIDADAFARRLQAALPKVAPWDRDGTLFGAIFDLVLLHTGRDAFGRQEALGTLVGDVFPLVGPLLGRAPSLVASLSNAVEGSGLAGPALARTFSDLGPLVEAPAQLLDAGAVAAWRLGRTRVRDAALRVAPALPPRALLTALALADWPDAAAPLVIDALTGDGWRHPREALSSRTLATLDRMPPAALSRLASALLAPQPAPLAIWTVKARAGDFSGFGGPFDATPVLLGAEGRHRVFVTSGTDRFVVEADCFGWACRRAPADLEVPRAPMREWSLLRVLPDGTLNDGREKVHLRLLDGASSFASFPRGVACGLQGSYRIRFAVPRSIPL